MSKVVHFLGIPVTVVSEEEQAQLGPDAVYVMMRVADDDPRLAWPDLLRRRVKTLCDTCREPCWLDPKSFAGTPAHVPRICIPCLHQRAEAEKAAEQAAEQKAIES